MMLDHAGTEGASLRVALCHLESLVCLPAINRLFAELGGAIGLVILSDRFGSKHRGLIRQFVASAGRSGLSLTLWLGFDIVAAQIAGRIGTWVETLTHRRPRLRCVRKLAKSHGAMVREAADVNGAETIAAVRAYAPDFVFVMNFDQILRQNFIEATAGQLINVHPSLLPALRGPCPVFWALAESRSEVGASLHLIEDQKIDAGPVLAQRALPLDCARSVAEITATLFEEGAALVPKVVKALRQGCSTTQSQDEEAGASYRGFPTRAEVARARALGVRLWSVRSIAKLLAAAVT